MHNHNRNESKHAKNESMIEMSARRAPCDLAMKALSMYDEQAKREKLLRKIVTITLVSLIPLLGIVLTIILLFLNYDLMTLVTWLVESDVMAVLGYILIIIMSAGVFSLLFVRIWQMRRSLNSHIKE